ncbi:serine/threonine protein kinase, partial [Streptomyces sp. NPDC127079]
DAILVRTGAVDTVEQGRSRDPWLPGSLVAQLGRHAVELLEVEDPTVYGALRTSTDQEARGTSEAGARGGAGSAAAGAGARPATAHPQSPHHSTPPEHTTAHPAYGYPQPHPQPTPYNPYTTVVTPDPAPTPPVPTPPPPPYDPDATDEPRRTRSTALLVTVALIVMLAAGGSVYALLNNGGSGDDAKGPDRPTPTTSAAAPTTSEEPSPTPSPSASTSPVVPTSFLGTWTTAIDNSTGHNTRELTIRQGAVGDTVLTLVAAGPGYRCEFTAKLAGRPGAGGPLDIGPSTVTSGKPLSSCTAGDPTEVTLLPDGRLKRATKGGGESLTYSKG